MVVAATWELEVVRDGFGLSCGRGGGWLVLGVGIRVHGHDQGVLTGDTRGCHWEVCVLKVTCYKSGQITLILGGKDEAKMEICQGDQSNSTGAD